MHTILFKRVLGWLLVSSGMALAQSPGDAPSAPDAQVQGANAPPQVVASAVAAVEKLGMDVTKGDFKVAIDRMNPEWMSRLAKQTPGGREAIQKQLEGAARRLAQEGVSIVSSVPSGQTRNFEVGPAKRIEKVNGQDVEVLVFTKWMVLVPTLTKYRMLLKGDPKPLFIEKVGFQVAVADKGKENWSFIDGSNLTVSALRRVYPSLPKDMRLPPIEERRAK